MIDFPLLGKKIIFFCPKTFGYENVISCKMESLGSEVTFHSDRPVEHPWVKALIRIFPRLAWRYSDVIFFSWLKNKCPKACDIILIIKGGGLSVKFLKALKSKYPSAKIILYLWDSVSNVIYTER